MSFTYRKTHPILMPLLAVLLAVGLGACDDNGNNSRKRQADNPVVRGPITGGGEATCCIFNFFGVVVDLRDIGYTPGTPFYAGITYDEAEVGYRETEYFISGTATSYIGTDDFGDDGIWPVQQADTAPYTSRIVVLRPEDAADFNGTVVVEWFNVSGGLDAAPDWTQLHTQLRRSGAVFVGVSAQSAGIEGGGAFDLPLKLIDPERYGALSHPGDSFSYDIFSQAAQAVRNPVNMDPLDGLKVERIIAVGQSQSASRLVTYVNAVHPTIDLFDGFLIHSRGGSAAPLSQLPLDEVGTPNPAFIRADLQEPVITLQTETDIFRLNSIAQRQADSDNFRLWEVAGTAHSDLYTTVKGPQDRGDDPMVADVVEQAEARPPFIVCDFPVNDGPGHFVAKAAIAALDDWIRNGEAAPSAPLLELDEAGTGFAYDSVGNVRGGIRTPYVDAPVAMLSGEGQPPTSTFCPLFGVTTLFDADTLSGLYPDAASYIDAIDTAADAAVGEGFLLPVDAGLIKDRARTSGIGGP